MHISNALSSWECIRNLLSRGQREWQMGKEKKSLVILLTNTHKHTHTHTYMHIDVNTQIYKHLPAGIFKKDIIHHVGSIFDKAMKLSACIPEGSFCRAHLSASRREHAPNVIWTFQGFEQRCRDWSLLNRIEAEDRMSGCDRASAALILYPFCLLSCLSLLTQTVPASQKYCLCLCVVLVKHTVQEDTIYRSPSFSNVGAHSRGQEHNHWRISPDNHCGAAGNRTKSKQTSVWLHFCVYLCAILCLRLHCCDDCYPVSDKTQDSLGSVKPHRSDLPSGTVWASEEISGRCEVETLMSS